MRVYEVGSRGNYLGLAALCSAVGIPFVLIGLLWPLGLMVVNEKSQASSAWDLLQAGLFLVMGLSALCIAWRYAARLPYRVVVADDGRIEVTRLLGSLSIRPCEVSSIEKAVTKVGLEGQDAREIRLIYTGGCAPVPYFAGVDDLIAGLVSRNPGIVTKDGWLERSRAD